WGGAATLTAGLRPESLRLAPPTNRNLAAEVCHVEALGNEQLLTCRLADGDHLLQVRVGPSPLLHPGERVHLEIDAQGWRFFDEAGVALPKPVASTGSPTPGPKLPIF
ncbi:MAG: TOBE domain-containing protein, partial [Cyanobacteria bacterium K_Offshore_0m_m2_072]|nr:TOBE domain-containing protein [Cyanobacteria bacterium K_Offshore_0m_m2_072]